MRRYPLLGLCVLLVLGAAPAVCAQNAANQMHRAYYLEHEDNDLATALGLYGRIAGDSRADAALRAKAKARAEVCREEIASADFTRLMPPSVPLGDMSVLATQSPHFVVSYSIENTTFLGCLILTV